MYRNPKVHKIVLDNISNFRPILSAIGTPVYKLAKFVVPIFSPLTVNDYVVKDSFSFAKELVNFDHNLFMASLDVEKLATCQSSSIFGNILYKQIDGFSMGSPLGPTLANAFLCHYEKLWLDNCPPEFKPVIYRRYVDDIIVLFKSKDHLFLFTRYVNTSHKNLKFTFYFKQNNSLSFLDINNHPWK